MRGETFEATASAVASKATYGGAGATATGWFLSNEFAVLVGLIVAIGGFLINWHYRARQDRREQEEHAARMDRIFRDGPGCEKREKSRGDSE